MRRAARLLAALLAAAGLGSPHAAAGLGRHAAAPPAAAPLPQSPADGTTPAAAQLTPGQLTVKLTCAASPDESYALYLPAAYDARHAWPIVYVLDPRGRGERAARLFVPGAERFGYVVASSYNSLSDGPLAPTVTAMRAMWNDTHARLRLDDRQVYAAGFSGTVRAAVILARQAPGTFAGIVGAAAGWPDARVPDNTTGPPFFGTVGNRDFNYLEMMQLDDRLAALAVPHRIEVFDGVHQWPPPDLATAALAWMTLGALRAGARAADPPLAAALFTPRLAAARALDDGAHVPAAARAFRELADDFQGLRPPADLEPVSRRAAELAALPAVAAAAHRQAERLRQEQHDVTAALHTLTAALAAPPGDAAALPRALADLHVDELRGRAHDAADPDDRLAAQRQLDTLLVQSSFYLPRRYQEQKDEPRAELALSIAAAIDPQDPDNWYQLAACEARQGRRKPALKHLEAAAAAGFADAAHLAADADFAALRNDADFTHLLARLRAAPPPSPPASPSPAPPPS